MNIKPVPVELVGQALMDFVITYNPLDVLQHIAGDLPKEVLTDVRQRIHDWLVSGGHHTDHYVRQQVAYAQKVYAAMKGGEKG